MEFHTKLHQLRKQKNWTQEELAEKLYISRTTISKWETGKGYPSIESLKNISTLFSVTIDDLLSSEELIFVAEKENIDNQNDFQSLIIAIINISTILMVFLPLYSRQDKDMIRSVTLFSNPDINLVTLSIYTIFPIVLMIFGIIQLIFLKDKSREKISLINKASTVWHILAIFTYVSTRQAAATSVLFILLVVKVLIFIKDKY